MTSQRGGRSVTFHIGLERTGTTSIQKFCFVNRNKLLRHSVLYPSNSPAFQGMNHIGLACCYLPPDAQDHFARTNPDKGPVLALLKAEIDASEARTILLSSEHFSSRLRGPQIRELAADFSEFDCRVVIVLRDHAARFYSLYATHIAGGGQVDIDQFAGGVLSDRSLEFRYADVIEAWREAFGPDRVECFLPGRRDIVRWFFGAGGPSPLDAAANPATLETELDFVGDRANRSLGPRRTAWLRTANRFVAGRLPSRTATAMAVKQSICGAIRDGLLLMDGLERTDGPADGDAWGLAPELRRRLDEVARADAARLEERFCLRMTSN